MKPVKREWNIGTDAHGRRVRLVNDRSYDGKDVWSIISEAYDQRDDGERIDSLSLSALKAIAAIVETA